MSNFLVCALINRMNAYKVQFYRIQLGWFGGWFEFTFWSVGMR